MTDGGGTAKGNYQKIIHEGTIVTQATDLTNDFWHRPPRWHAVPVKVTDEGVYTFNAAVRGRHNPVYEKCGISGIDNHRVDIDFFLVVKRPPGLFMLYQLHDSYQWAQFYTAGFYDFIDNGEPNYRTEQNNYGHYGSIPWNVQGSGNIYLQADDEVYGLLRFNGVGGAWRTFYVKYIAFDMTLVSTGAPTTAQTPHTLTDNDAAEFWQTNWS
jgi:hypothetical protein